MKETSKEARRGDRKKKRGKEKSGRNGFSNRLKLCKDGFVDAFVDEVRTDVVDNVCDDVKIEVCEVDSHS